MSSPLPLHAVAFQNAPERRQPVDLAIKGTIPSWLTGSLYRTGPGTYTTPTDKNKNSVVAVQHWFDGLTMHHRFEIHPGGKQVSYTSRNGSEDYKEEAIKNGKLVGTTFGQRDLCQTIFRKFFATFDQDKISTPSSHNVGVTISPNMPGWGKIIDGLPKQSKAPLSHTSPMPKYLVAKTDANILQLLNPTSLEPLALATYTNLDSRLDGDLSAAHSCSDPETGEFFNFVLKLGSTATYKVFRMNKEGEVTVLCEIKDAPPSYLHSFAMTSKYVVLIVWQAHIGGHGLPVLYHKNIVQAIKKWNPALDSLFYVIDRSKGGIVAKYKAPPFFCFHQLNSFDDPAKDDILIDLSSYEDHSIIEGLYLDKIRSPDPTKAVPLIGRARRYRLPSVTSGKPNQWESAQVEFTLPDTQAIELPTIHPAKYHRPYRYVYGINKQPGLNPTFADGIIKLDMDNKDGGHKMWEVKGYSPSEPIFVPRPGAEDEDDGVVLSVMLDGEKARSMLLILDAKEMKELARAEMETVYPIGFHGVFTSY